MTKQLKISNTTPPNRFKFRAWDKKEKNMVYYPCVALNDNWFQTCVDDKNFEVMQSSGQVCRMGREIFEGDIIKVAALRDGRDCFEVIFFEGSFCLRMPEGYYPFSEYVYYKDFEVIGDKFENPNIEFMFKGE